MGNEGKNCPKCNLDIGLWVIIKAPFPRSLKCKHCAEMIGYEKKGWPMILICHLLYLSIVYWIIRSGAVSAGLGFVYLIVFMVLFWQLFEIAMAMILRRYHKLTLVDGPK